MINGNTNIGGETYSIKFNYDLPKKQAKSYEIDLGQNNGPYKEDLLIRYGDPTVNQMMHKYDNRTNMNMEDIMKMNEILRPYQEKEKLNTLDNVGEQCVEIEKNLADVDDLSNYLTEFEADVNKSIEMMTNEVFKYFDDNYNEFNPELLENYKLLKSKIKDQKDENANHLKQIDFLNTEIKQILENIIKLGNRLGALEALCGLDNEERDLMKNTEYDDDDNQSDSKYD